MIREEKDYYEYADFQHDLAVLIGRIKQRGKKYTNIWAPPRGGWILAVFASHLLGIPVIWDITKITNDTLVLDDICDTGATFLRLLKRLRSPWRIIVRAFRVLFSGRYEKIWTNIFNVRPDFIALYINPAYSTELTLDYAREKTHRVVFFYETRKSAGEDGCEDKTF